MSESTTIEYPIWIRATPDKVWDALTLPEYTAQWWQATFESDWKEGSKVVWHVAGFAIRDEEQVVLKAEPAKLLSYTWHSFTPEWAQACKVDEAVREKLAGPPRTKATFKIDEIDGLVRLTLLHEGFDPAGIMRGMCGPTWPRLLSALKTLLETGTVMKPF
jgi:uncharacterized protein YndB with AHSA1/START domain